MPKYYVVIGLTSTAAIIDGTTIDPTPYATVEEAQARLLVIKARYPEQKPFVLEGDQPLPLWGGLPCYDGESSTPDVTLQNLMDRLQTSMSKGVRELEHAV
jgi:hypothetical protein